MQGLGRKRSTRLEEEGVVGKEEDSVEGEGEVGGAEAEEDEQEPGKCAPQFIRRLPAKVKEESE